MHLGRSKELIHPRVRQIAASGYYDDRICNYCANAFESVWRSNLTFFQVVVVGDEWGPIVIPIIEHYPWTSLIFLGINFTVAIGLINLVLAVVVDKAAEAREQDVQHQIALKERRQREAKSQLVKLCYEMDTDRSGALTLLEIIDGFNNSPGFRSLLEVLDVDKEDLEMVFKIMDVDKSGDVSFKEFVNLLFKMKQQHSKTLLMFIKHYVLDVRHDVREQLAVLKEEVVSDLHYTMRTQKTLQRGLSSLIKEKDSESSEVSPDRHKARGPPRRKSLQDLFDEVEDDITSDAQLRGTDDVMPDTQLPGTVHVQPLPESDKGASSRGLRGRGF